MKQLRLNVAITVDYRFVPALAFGVVALTIIVLLLRKWRHSRRCLTIDG